jgi:hypothetical protein
MTRHKATKSSPEGSKLSIASRFPFHGKTLDEFVGLERSLFTFTSTAILPRTAKSAEKSIPLAPLVRHS